MFYRWFVRPFLFQMPAERAHHFTFRLWRFVTGLPGVGAWAKNHFTVSDPVLEREVFGLKFPNPVGLAAGFDKDAKGIDAFSALGFGFIEIGTLTPKPQDGNPQPRMFRLKADRGLINRMGFNNGGVEAAVKRLKQRKSPVLVGGNIGKNKVTPNEEAARDYEVCFEALFPVVDYFVVNVSSPNTPNLRALQDKEPLTALLMRLQQRNQAKKKPKPMLLKIAPDLTEGQLDDIVEIIRETKLDGVIATNTTISRDGLETPAQEVEAMGAGGLSGAPVKDRATQVIRHLHHKSGGAFPIIGVGGIQKPEDAWEKLEAGASLVQVYSGFVYEGPAMVRNINRYLRKKLS